MTKQEEIRATIGEVLNDRAEALTKKEGVLDRRAAVLRRAMAFTAAALTDAGFPEAAAAYRDEFNEAVKPA